MATPSESLPRRASKMLEHPKYGSSPKTAFAVDLLNAIAAADGLTDYQKWNLANLVDCYVYHKPTSDYYWAQVEKRKAFKK